VNDYRLTPSGEWYNAEEADMLFGVSLSKPHTSMLNGSGLFIALYIHT